MKTSKWIAAVLAAALFIAAIAALVGCTKEQPRTDVSPPPVVNEPMGGETTGEPTEPLEGTMTVKGSDTIVHLEQGRIHSRGTHEDLLMSDAGYAELFRRQTWQHSPNKQVSLNARTT